MSLYISIPYPPELTHCVLSSALGSSCGAMWLANYTFREQSKAGVGPDQRYGDLVALHVGAPLCTDTPRVKHGRIGASRIACALEVLLAYGEPNLAAIAARVLAGSSDAPDADVVLQVAAFGEVIYG